MKFVPSADELTGDGRKRKHRLIGKWKRQLDVYDSECSTSMRYLMLFSTAFNDMRDGYAVYYGSFSMLLRMIVGITSGAAHDWRISAYVFLALYGLDLIVICIVYPYVDIIRNRMEVLLAMTRTGLVVVGFLYLRSDLDTDTSEAALFWLGIGSIGVAFLYQAVEIGGHIWTIAKISDHTRKDNKKILERRKSHLSIHSAIDDNQVVVPHSLTTFRNVGLYDDMGDRHQILDKRFLVVKVTIQGANGLASVDCRRNRTVCIAKIGQNDLEAHHRNFGTDPVTFHDSEAVYKTKSEGLTLTAHAAWWNEEFPIQVDNNEGIMTFVVWERIGEDWRNLGTAIVQMEPLLHELNCMPQPIEKKYPLVLHGKNVKSAEKKRRMQNSLMLPGKKDEIATGFKPSTEELDVGQLSLAFECDFARLWPLADSRHVHDYRLSTLSTTYVELDMQDTIRPPAKYSRSESLRRALVGSHYHSAVSRSAAADNAMGLADATWRFEKDVSMTIPTIWDRGMPEGDENERHGYYNVTASNVVLHEGSGASFVRLVNENELHQVVRRDVGGNKAVGGQWRLEPTVNRNGRARPSAGALTGSQPAADESGHWKNPLLQDGPEHGTEEVEVAI